MRFYKGFIDSDRRVLWKELAKPVDKTDTTVKFQKLLIQLVIKG